MARTVVVQIVDDLDGTSTAQETVSFALSGVSYEIDLSSAHATELRAAFAPWVERARRTGGRAIRRPSNATAGRKPRTDPDELAQVRAWAREQGMPVSSRGRIAGEVVRAWREEHQASSNQDR